MTTPGARHDADLDDLLEESATANSPSKQEHLEMAPLNLDHLTMGQLDVLTSSSVKKQSESNTTLISPLHYIQGLCLYCAYAHPRICSCMVMGMIISVIFLLSFSIMNPTFYLGEIQQDLTNIKSSFDLKLGQIDHWCLAGGDNSCRCEDPLVPTERGEFKPWTIAHAANKQLLKQQSGGVVDVAFLGESLVEEMNGRWMGRTNGAQLQTMRTMFQNKFTRNSSGVEGIALGIAGDTSPNVLWRLLHGEMPATFSPKIWWVSLGMNDLGRMQCSEEVVVMGILRVVEEILTQKTTAKVVINSMLPMADLRGGMYPKITDYQDAFAGKTDESHYARKPVTNNAKGPVITGNEERVLKKKEDTMSEGDDTVENVEKNIKKFRKDPRNPILDANRHKFHKYHVLPRNAKLPLWTSIHAINEELRKFASKHDRVTFFDATDIFASRVELNRYVLQSDMISIRGHPTVAGYEAWEDAILTRVKKMLDQEKLETPESSKEETKEEKKEPEEKSEESEEESEEKSEESEEESEEKNEESEEETEEESEESEEETEEESEESEEETKEHKSSEEDVTAKKDQAKKTKDEEHESSSHAETKRKGKDPSESGDKSESGEESKSGDSKE